MGPRNRDVTLLRHFLARATPSQVVAALGFLTLALPGACLLWLLVTSSGAGQSIRELLCAKALPAKPLPGQATPPCPEPLQALPNGGCFQEIKATADVCARSWYEWDGRCYAPAFYVEHPSNPNSSRPRQVRYP